MRINLNHLSMIYPNGRQALKDISLTLESPSLIGLVGPNGAGKSTLMKLLVAGLLPTGGTISVDDVPLSRCEKKLKEKLGYLPQDFGLYDELTVREFLEQQTTSVERVIFNVFKDLDAAIYRRLLGPD